MTYIGDGTPLQRSMLRDVNHYRTSEMKYPKLGVILEVRSADDPRNRAARERDDRRGWMAEATVFLTDDCAFLEHVMITPDGPSGLDSFQEYLPRGSKASVKGVEMNENLTQIDPNDLDGDWCIVEFLDGNIQKPFISRYWPNPRNVYDCATSGTGNPTFSTNKGQSLDQRGRFFKRTNGVEYVVSKSGDVFVSTALAGNTLDVTGISKDGRFPRLSNGKGGSIMVNIRPSKAFELSFDEQVDGIGSGALPDASLPQRNPALPPPRVGQQVNTQLKADKQKIEINVPLSFKVVSKTSALIDAPNIYLGENAVDMAAMAAKVLAELTKLQVAYNTLLAAVKAPMVIANATPVGPGPVVTVPSGSLIGLPALPTPGSVAAVKVHVE